MPSKFIRYWAKNNDSSTSFVQNSMSLAYIDATLTGESLKTRLRKPIVRRGYGKIASILLIIDLKSLISQPMCKAESYQHDPFQQ